MFRIAVVLAALTLAMLSMIRIARDTGPWRTPLFQKFQYALVRASRRSGTPTSCFDVGGTMTAGLLRTSLVTILCNSVKLLKTPTPEFVPVVFFAAFEGEKSK